MSTTTAKVLSKPGNITALMVALLTACVAFQLNASMLSPALVTMGEELNASQAAIGLSQTWFFTAAAVFSLFLPRLSDIIGRKKVLLGMMVMMGVGSIISAMAPDITLALRWTHHPGHFPVPRCPFGTAHVAQRGPRTRRRYGALMGLTRALMVALPASTPSLAATWPKTTGSVRSSGSWWSWPCSRPRPCPALLTRETKPQAGTKMDWQRCLFHRRCRRRPADGPERGLQAGRRHVPPKHCCSPWCCWRLPPPRSTAFWMTEKRVAEAPMVQIEPSADSAPPGQPLLTTVLTMTGIFAVINGIVPAYVQAAGPGLRRRPPRRPRCLYPHPVRAAGLGLRPAHAVVWHRCSATTRCLRVGMLVSIVALSDHRVLRPQLPADDDCRHRAAGHHVRRNGKHHAQRTGRGASPPPGNPGFLPGMNAGAFNLGAGLSFLVLPAVLVGNLEPGRLMPRTSRWSWSAWSSPWRHSPHPC